MNDSDEAPSQNQVEQYDFIFAHIARMKSSCCGAEIETNDTPIHYYCRGKIVNIAEVGEDKTCDECREFCQEIPDDVMSKKEILEFCDSYLEIDIYYLEKHLKEIMHKENLLEFRQALKSVKEHLK